MTQSKFKRPRGFEGVQNDPEESYRAGYQHGAREVLHYLQTTQTTSMEQLENWINADLGKWRHDTTSEPIPPKLK